MPFEQRGAVDRDWGGGQCVSHRHSAVTLLSLVESLLLMFKSL